MGEIVAGRVCVQTADQKEKSKQEKSKSKQELFAQQPCHLENKQVTVVVKVFHTTIKGQKSFVNL